MMQLIKLGWADGQYLSWCRGVYNGLAMGSEHNGNLATRPAWQPGHCKASPCRLAPVWANTKLVVLGVVRWTESMTSHPRVWQVGSSHTLVSAAQAVWIRNQTGSGSDPELVQYRIGMCSMGILLPRLVQ